MMNFDERVRQQIRREGMQLQPEAEIRLERRMAQACSSRPKSRAHWIAAALAACVIVPAAVFFAMLPSREDVRSGILLPNDRPVIQPLAQTLTAPEVDAQLDGERLTVRMHNATDEIWLLKWCVDGGCEWIWLEPGAECAAAFRGTPGSRALCHAYRVTADVLHWLEGDVLPETDEGYADQQALMEDAFANGALLLAPGDWANGEAGPMILPLPQSYLTDHPDADAAEVYTQSGDLTDGGLVKEITFPSVSPSTGREVEGLSRPVAVSISVSETTLPCGLQHADVIYESWISTSATRMTALFHDALGRGEIIAGPVRSVRTSHLSISNEWGAALVYSHSTSGSANAAPGLRDLPQPNIGLSEHPQYRVRLQSETGRRVKAPDVFAVDVSALHADDAHAPFAAQGWTFGPASGGESAEEITLRFGKRREVRFRYQDGAYHSSIVSYLHPQGTEQTTLSFSNLIVIEADYESIGGSGWVISPVLVGEGSAWIYRGGRMMHGTWERENEQSPTRFRDAQGQEIALAQGCSYVAVKRKDGTV